MKAERFHYSLFFKRNLLIFVFYLTCFFKGAFMPQNRLFLVFTTGKSEPHKLFCHNIQFI